MEKNSYDDLMCFCREKKIPMHIRKQIAYLYNASQEKESFTQKTLTALNNGEIPCNIGVPHSITLLSDGGCYGPMPEEKDEIIQKLTITENGRIYISYYNWEEKFLRREVLNIPTKDAVSILNIITAYFSVYVLEPRCTDVGSWDLTITNQNMEKFTFSGDLFGIGENWYGSISNFIRKTLSRNNLLVFDGSNNDETVLYVCEFEFGGKHYYYKSDMPLCMGDRVIVPCGDDGDKGVATIVDTEFFDEYNPCPFPMEKIKEIIEPVEPKITKDNPTLFEIIKAVIDSIDCEGFLEMGCPADEYDGESRMIEKTLNFSMTYLQIADCIAKVMTRSFEEPYAANSFIVAGLIIQDLLKLI